VKAIVIRDTGELERLELPEFADVQKACGGTILVDAGENVKVPRHVDGEVVESPSIMGRFEHLTMWCNEEAQLLGLAQNVTATKIVGWLGAEYPDGTKAMLYGDVVITGPTGRNGNRTALSDEDADAIMVAA
jgi:hypothetical protein